jgi:hypothetical protein
MSLKRIGEDTSEGKVDAFKYLMITFNVRIGSA